MIDLIIQIILLIVGFVFLIKGADYFVSGSSSVAALLKIPTIIVGLTIVAIGTSAPEAAVSITAAVNGNNAMAVSNIIGSNLFNLLFIIGLCAMLKELDIGRQMLEKDYPFLIVATVAIVAFILIGWNILRIEGIVLLILFAVYLFYLVYSAKKSKEGQYVEKPKLTLPKSIVYMIVGLVGIVLGGELVVNNASSIAITFGMSETLVGLTIVSIGTSLPEVATSLTALKRKENELVIGNVIGSNLFNIIFVLALSATISPITLQSNILVDLCLMLFITVLTYIFARTQNKFDKKEGILLLVIFIIYMAFVIMRN